MFRLAGAAPRTPDWHWVDPVAASAECVRILRPGGTLGLIWNHLDLTDPRIAALTDAMHRLDPGDHRHDHTASEVRPPLRPAGVSELSRQLPMTTRALAELVTTRSYYLVREAADQELLREHCSRVVLEEFGTIDDEPIPVPHLNIGHRFRLDG